MTKNDEQQIFDRLSKVEAAVEKNREELIKHQKTLDEVIKLTASSFAEGAQIHKTVIKQIDEHDVYLFRGDIPVSVQLALLKTEVLRISEIEKEGKRNRLALWIAIIGGVIALVGSLISAFV